MDAGKSKKRKTDTGMAFLDLMLCTIGCTLMIFAAQIPQQRGGGRGWDDRPLVIHAASFGDAAAYRDGRLTFRWELAPVGKSPPAIVVTPTGDVRPAEGVTFLVPEAEFGDWQLTVTVFAEPTDVGQAVRDLDRAGVIGGSMSEVVRTHLRLYDQYRALLKRDVTAEDVARFRDALSAAGPVPGIELRGSGSNEHARDDVRWYLEYRRLAMTAVLLARSGSDPGPVNAKIAELLRQVDAAAAGEKDSTTTAQAVRIRLAIRVDHEIRTGHMAGPAWEELTAHLKQFEDVPSTAWDSNPAYWAFVAEWIRGRARQEYGLQPGGAGPGPDYRRAPSYERNVRETAVRGRQETLFQVVAHEVATVGRVESGVTIDFGVRWGDTAWPEAEAGTDPAKVSVRFAPKEYNQPIPVALIRLSADRKSPLVLQELR